MGFKINIGFAKPVDIRALLSVCVGSVQDVCRVRGYYFLIENRKN